MQQTQNDFLFTNKDSDLQVSQFHDLKEFFFIGKDVKRRKLMGEEKNPMKLCESSLCKE